MLGIDTNIFPHTAEVNEANHLVIGGCDAVELAQRFGTPLYVFDEVTLRRKCREFVQEFVQRYPDSQVVYACKAYINPALARLFNQEGLGLEVVSGGELATAQKATFPMDKIYFHGNNKGRDELEMAVRLGVGRVVIDNLDEIELLNDVAKASGKAQAVLLRVSPGVDPHTHGHTTTGTLDSKFGIPIQTGQAEEAVIKVMHASHLDPVGLHFHLGSPIFQMEPYQEAIEVTMAFAAAMRERHGLEIREFSPGGGFAIQYTEDKPPPRVAQYADAIVSALHENCKAPALPPPKLILEPGRAIVGQAGVALYTVGAIKEIPGVRKYVSVDGGMGDNIRPAIYGAKYEAILANRMGDKNRERVTIAGKFCESGDILVEDVEIPHAGPGDTIAIPASGAYCLSMASNYNAAPKPPVVLVKDGEAQLIRRRETFEDLMRCDLI